MQHNTLGLGNFITIVWARRWTILLLMAVAVGVAVVLSLNSPTVYKSTATVLIDFEAPVGDESTAALAAGLQDDYLTTQVGILASRRVAARVVDNLSLETDPAWQAAYKTSGRSGVPQRDWIAGSLLANLTAAPGKNSRLVEVTYSSENPETAARLANAFAQAYEQIALDMNTQPAQKEAEQFEQTLEELRDNLVSTQAKLSAYQREHGLVSDEQLEMETTRLQDLLAQRVQAEGDLKALEDKYARVTDTNVAQESLDALPEVLGNEVVRDLKRELTAKEAEFAEIQRQLGSGHPRYQSVAAELSTLSTRLAAEVRSVARGIKDDVEQARARLQSYAKAETDHQARVMELAQAHDQLTALIEEQRNAQQSYDLGLQRYNQFRVQSRLSQTNVTLISPALVPTQEAGPSMPRTVLLAAILGLILGIAYAVLRELLDGRIRSDADAKAASPGELLGTLPRAR